MNEWEWKAIALLVDQWGLPGAVFALLAWAMHRFGIRPTPHVAMTSETAAAIKALSDRMDGHNATAREQREEMMTGLHGLDKRLAVLETTVAERKR